MKQPITVTVERELGNAGDVITTIRDADGDVRKFACPGDCSPYAAVVAIRAQLEEVLNEPLAPVVSAEKIAEIMTAAPLIEAAKASVIATAPTTVDDLIAATKPSAGDA